MTAHIESSKDDIAKIQFLEKEKRVIKSLFYNITRHIKD